MGARRRRGPWFRLTEEEKILVERVMAELDDWEPGMPPPEHSIEEHLAAARLAVDDVGARVDRLWLNLVLWVLAWLVLIGFAAYAVAKWFL